MITIKNIAKIAGVSHTTVSRALNDSPLIKPETKTRIKNIAKQLGYVPNYSAKNLVLQKSHTIGLFLSSLSQGTSASFLVNIIHGVSSVISKNSNYTLSVHGLDIMKDFSTVVPQHFDGIILASQSEQDESFVEHVITQNIPLVILNRVSNTPNISTVLTNDRLGVKHAIDFAIENGHTRIGIIEGKHGFKSTIERKSGFLESLSSHALSLPSSYAVIGDYTTESGYEKMLELLDLDMPPTLVFCSNDDMAIGAIKACHAKNLRIPDDISIIGFDDILFAKYTAPALTTVHKPMTTISKTGANQLLWLLENPTDSPKQIILDTSFEIRNSVAKK